MKGVSFYKGSKGWIVAAAVVALLAIFPFFSPRVYFLSLFYTIFLYVVLAQSWNIIGGFAGYLSFGHVVFFGIGAYVTAYLKAQFDLSSALTILASLTGGLASAIVAAVIGYPCLRLRGPYFAVVTLCFAFVVQMLVENLSFFGGVEGMWLQAMKGTVASQRTIFYQLMLLLMVLMILMVRKIERSKLGAGLLAIKEDEEVAQSVGIHTPRVKMTAFVLSAFFPGMAGGIHAFYLTYISPVIVFDVMISILIVLMTLFGGGGSWVGALIGAVSLSLLNEFLTTFMGAEVARIIYGMLFLGVIIYMPNGVLEFIRSGRSRPVNA